MDEQTKKDYHAKVNDNIERYGYHMTFVDDSKASSFCYTTGIFKTCKIPEIFISALPQNLSFELIRKYVELFNKSKDIPLNTKIDTLTERFSVYLIEVPYSRLHNYVLSTLRFYKNEEVKYLQLIFPDTRGLFPTEIGYDYDQEIIGALEM